MNNRVSIRTPTSTRADRCLPIGRRWTAARPFGFGLGDPFCVAFAIIDRGGKLVSKKRIGDNPTPAEAFGELTEQVNPGTDYR